MATAAVAVPNPQSPRSHGHSPAKTDTPTVRPPSPSAPPPMFGPQSSATPVYERRDSGESIKDEHGRSQSTPLARPVSPSPRRTSSAGTLPPFLASTAILSPPSFHPANNGNSSPESRQTRSSEHVPTINSSPDLSPHQHHPSIGGTPYQNGPHMAMRPSEHELYAGQDYDAMMRPKKRHKTSRACDECRRKKVFSFYVRSS